MIAMLRGLVADTRSDHAVIDVSGVGYRVSLPGRTLSEMTLGEELTLHISTQVREDAISLFGFESPSERDAFDVVRQVNGIGPRLAMAILGTMSVQELSHAVDNDDRAALVRIPGIGRKTASRLCLELKNKLAERFGVEHSGSVSNPPAKRAPDPIVLALARLDYRKSEIDLALAAPSVPKLGEASIEERLSASLRVLARPM